MQGARLKLRGSWNEAVDQNDKELLETGNENDNS